MTADGALSGIFGLALPLELHEGADQSRVLFSCEAIVALEGGFRLGRAIGAAGRQFGVERVSEISCALPSVLEIGDACRVAAATMTSGDRTKRLLFLADDIEAACAGIVRARRVHGEITR